MKFKVIDFDLRIKPSKNEGKILVIYKTEYLEEITHEIEVKNLDYILEMLFSNFRGTAVEELEKLEQEVKRPVIKEGRGTAKFTVPLFVLYPPLPI